MNGEWENKTQMQNQLTASGNNNNLWSLRCNSFRSYQKIKSKYNLIDLIGNFPTWGSATMQKRCYLNEIQTVPDLILEDLVFYIV